MLMRTIDAVALGVERGDGGGARSARGGPSPRQRRATTLGPEAHGGPGRGREAGQEEARRRAREANPGPGLVGVSFISRTHPDC